MLWKNICYISSTVLDLECALTTSSNSVPKVFLHFLYKTLPRQCQQVLKMKHYQILKWLPVLWALGKEVLFNFFKHLLPWCSATEEAHHFCPLSVLFKDIKVPIYVCLPVCLSLLLCLSISLFLKLTSLQPITAPMSSCNILINIKTQLQKWIRNRK